MIQWISSVCQFDEPDRKENLAIVGIVAKNIVVILKCI